MAPAQCEQGFFNRKTNRFQRKITGIIDVGQEKQIGNVSIQGTANGFMIKTAGGDGERVSYDATDRYGMDNERRLVTSSGEIIYITAIKKEEVPSPEPQNTPFPIG